MAFQPTLSKFGVPLQAGTSGIGILMPKLKYRFRVSMQNFGPIGTALALTRQVETCGRPVLNHDMVELHSYNNIVYIPKKPNWSNIEIKVRDDVSNSVSSLVGAQIQKQMNHFDQTSALAGINFKFTTIIEVLDGGNTGVLENWYLEGCYLETVNYDSHDYTSSDPVAITLTVRFDNATQDNTIMPQIQPPTGLGPMA
jgi:predicted transglutaminase-like cysteine proteinase